MKLANITSIYRADLLLDTYDNWLNKNDEQILDIGCGNGIVSEYISKKLDKKITGCDIDKYLEVDIPFKKMKKSNKIPFNRKFDVCMFNDVLHHIPYDVQIELIKDALRVSNKVLIFELKPRLISKIADFGLNKIHHFRMEIPYTYRTKQEWLKVFNQEGFKANSRDARQPLLYPFTHVAFKVSKT